MVTAVALTGLMVTISGLSVGEAEPTMIGDFLKQKFNTLYAVALHCFTVSSDIKSILSSKQCCVWLNL